MGILLSTVANICMSTGKALLSGGATVAKSSYNYIKGTGEGLIHGFINIIVNYLKICIFGSIFICFFILGGYVTPIISIIYMYYIFIKRIKCSINNIPSDSCK